MLLAEPLKQVCSAARIEPAAAKFIDASAYSQKLESRDQDLSVRWLIGWRR